MTRLQLSVAMGDYDRTRALLDGRVQIDGVDPVFMLLSPEEMFFRAMRSTDFDITELSFSSCLVQHSRGEGRYIAVPVFLSRALRHTSIYVRKDRIKAPPDLKGKRVGVPEYQLTANVWARAILHDDHGVAPAARECLGEDYWSYGVAAALRTLEAFVRHHHSQRLSALLVAVQELFHPATYESYSI